MANAAGFIQESIWRDSHWRSLSRTAQATYMQLLSQKELDCAGVLPLQVFKWAKGCDSVTEADIWADLEELQRERFVFFDMDSDEAFIRTYIRNSNVIKSPNMMKSALRSARLVASEPIRVVLAAELRATGREDAEKVAQELNPLETLSEPFPNPSKSNPSETLSEPSGVGVGVGVPHHPTNPVGEEPSPFCSSHPGGTEDACFACGQARRTYPDRKAAWDKAVAEYRAHVRKNCIRCHGTNTYEDADGNVHKCDHILKDVVNE